MYQSPAYYMVLEIEVAHYALEYSTPHVVPYASRRRVFGPTGLQRDVSEGVMQLLTLTTEHMHSKSLDPRFLYQDGQGV